jgi:hypothetical protein
MQRTLCCSSCGSSLQDPRNPGIQNYAAAGAGMQSGGMHQAPVFDLDSRRTVKNDSGAFIGAIIEVSAVLDRCTLLDDCDANTHHSCLRY